MQEARELRDAQTMKAAAGGLREDATAARKEAAEERMDSRAIVTAASAALTREETDARVLDGVANQTRSTAEADELSDAHGMKAVAQEEGARSKQELSEADEEVRDADAMTR